MKIAISADQSNTHSKISSLGGRAPYYHIFNEKGELLETLPNPFTEDRGGVGVSTAKMLAEKEINVVISGTFGRKMADALKTKDIKYYEKEGLIKDALRDILSEN